MTTFAVSYDLKRPGQDYPKLWEELERLGAHRSLESFWLVSVTSTTAKEVHDHLKSFVDTNDAIWVLELTQNHWYSGARGGTNEWLKKNPPAR